MPHGSFYLMHFLHVEIGGLRDSVFSLASEVCISSVSGFVVLETFSKFGQRFNALVSFLCYSDRRPVVELHKPGGRS